MCWCADVLRRRRMKGHPGREAMCYQLRPILRVTALLNCNPLGDSTSKRVRHRFRSNPFMNKYVVYITPYRDLTNYERILGFVSWHSTHCLIFQLLVIICLFVFLMVYWSIVLERLIGVFLDRRWSLRGTYVTCDLSIWFWNWTTCIAVLETMEVIVFFVCWWSSIVPVLSFSEMWNHHCISWKDCV